MFPFFQVSLAFINFQLTPDLEKNEVITWELFKDLVSSASKIIPTCLHGQCCFSFPLLSLLWLHPASHSQRTGLIISSVLSVIIYIKKKKIFKLSFNWSIKKLEKYITDICKPLGISHSSMLTSFSSIVPLTLTSVCGVRLGRF